MRNDTLAGSSPLEREATDFYPTPEWVTERFLAQFQLKGYIWEPACGNGMISKVLKANGLIVYSSDLYDRGYGDSGVNFLTSDRRTDVIFTNPPYRLAVPFVTHALKCAPLVIMLFKLNFLAGQKRKAFFASTPLRSIHVLTKRVSFDKGNEPGKGAGLLEYAWFVWDTAYAGEPVIKWL